MTTKTLPNFEQVDSALSRANAVAETSEAHGILCGMLCASGKGDLNSWLSHILGDHDPRDLTVREVQRLLMDLHDATVEQMTDGSLALNLFLRNDDEPLDERIADLSDWCQGFLFGLGISADEDTQTYPENIQEVIEDIIDISQAGYEGEAGEDLEENETAYTEVVEYIRVGVMLVYSEMRDDDTDEHVQVTLH